MLLQSAGKYKMAINAFKQCELSESVRFHLGECFYKLKNYDNALAQFNNVVAGGSNLVAQTKRGIIYFK